MEAWLSPSDRISAFAILPHFRPVQLRQTYLDHESKAGSVIRYKLTKPLMRMLHDSHHPLHNTLKYTQNVPPEILRLRGSWSQKPGEIPVQPGGPTG
jgi:hypothetical protein